MKKLLDSVAMAVLAIACFAGVSGVAQAGMADDYRAPSLMTSETFRGTVQSLRFLTKNAHGDDISVPADKADSVLVQVLRDAGGTIMVTQDFVSGPSLAVGDAVKVVIDISGKHITK